MVPVRGLESDSGKDAVSSSRSLRATQFPEDPISWDTRGRLGMLVPLLRRYGALFKM